eukprot:SAG31_NODE_2569_length_5461_cov_6.801007_5_plen_373_part_00
MTVKSADPLHDDRRPIPSPMFGTMIGRPELTGAPAGEMDIEMNRVEWKHHQWTARIKHIFLGQLLAGLLCLTGVCSRNLVELGISAPSCQNAANYLVMAIICSPPLIRRRSANRYGAFLEQSGRSEGSGAARTERVAWSLGRWALVAVCDLEANYLAVKAYSLTTFSSAQLLDCAVLPCVIVLSTRILGHRYRLGHIGCAGLTLLGAVLMVITDWDGLAFGENTIEPDSVAESLAEDSHIGLQPNKSDGLRRTLGDILCLLSAALYACSNVGQEAGLMYAADGVRAATADWLGVLGLIGTPLSVLQIALFEREELEQLFGQQQEENAAPSLATFSKYVLRWLWLLLYAVALFSFYCIAPRLLAGELGHCVCK